MSAELYPGRSAVVCEMLGAWKDRNRWRRLFGGTLGERLSAADRREACVERLTSLRRVWRALRAAR